MTESKNRQWILNARPAGKLTGEEFLWNEAPIPRPSDGKVLIRTLWLSVDPAQRIWMARDSYKPAVPLGDVMQSFAVGQVLESRHPGFKPGELVRGEFGWQDYAVTDGKSFGGMHKLAPDIPPNLALGLFGLNGLTAYVGITEVGRVNAGDTVVVSGAAGATGSVAGQIAKIKGCRVIGTAGGSDKCAWLVNEAHFDAAIDYKSEGDRQGGALPGLGRLQLHHRDRALRRWRQGPDLTVADLLNPARRHHMNMENLRARSPSLPARPAAPARRLRASWAQRA
jgi:NADPH-dependent curcumin reductase CurA